LDLCLIAIGGLLGSIENILLVAGGLGFVIFVHELGHFLVAKACGVKCEKFYIGFDPPITVPFVATILRAAGLRKQEGPLRISSLWKHQWGETEYGIGVIPLGGYVKMLGQDDNPARAHEQMRRSRIHRAELAHHAGSGEATADANGDATEKLSEATSSASEAAPDREAGPAASEKAAAPLEAETPPGDEEGTAAGEPSGGGEAPDDYVLDPRSYLAKSVWQRMAIISAGVVMNVIFAFIFATIAYSRGVNYLPCVVSAVMPGSPAYQHDIRVGDTIVQVDGIEKPRFVDLKYSVSLGDLEQGVPLKIERADSGQVVSMRIKPHEKGTLPTIGVRPGLSLTLGAKPAVPNTPADRDTVGLQAGDQVVAVDGNPVQTYRDYQRYLTAGRERAITITVLRGAERGKSNAPGDSTGGKKVDILLPPNPMRRLGLHMKIGEISAIRANSPAAAAELRAGDSIEQIDGKPIEQFDPISLPDYFRERAVAGEKVAIKIARDGESGPQLLTKTLSPRAPTWVEYPILGDQPMSVPALGFAYQVRNQVQAVQPDSPASKAGIQPGDQITQAHFIPADDDDSAYADRLADKPVEFSAEQRNWPSFVFNLQTLPHGMQIELTVRNAEGERQVKVVPVEVADAFFAERGLNFEPLDYVRRAQSFGEAASLGLRETKESLLMVWRFLSKLGTQVPVTALGGPLTIVRGASHYAYESFAMLLIFLTMLSANLAVVNFLPIPVLDGGHMVFLLWEAFFRRPVSERVAVILQSAGLILILSLMLFVIMLDINRLL